MSLNSGYFPEMNVLWRLQQTTSAGLRHGLKCFSSSFKSYSLTFLFLMDLLVAK